MEILAVENPPAERPVSALTRCGKHVNSPRAQLALLEPHRPGKTRHKLLLDTKRDACLKDVPAVGFTSGILLVEDEETIRHMAGLYLESSGYRVLQANDARRAITLWENHACEIDLVVTDLMMPGGMNGHQLIANLQGHRPDLKAIFVSGYSPDSFDEHTILNRTTRFLQKPYRLKNLVEMVYDCLHEARPADATANSNGSAARAA
jgi:CheY-like chemotaxis protein